MQQIYENSSLTLVVADATSVRDGFLSERTEQYVAVKWLPNELHADPEDMNNIYLSKHWDPIRDKLVGPWSTRGWTFQESLLPSRLLYYTAAQMVWKCSNITRFERGVTLDPEQRIHDEFEHEGGRTFWSFDLFTKTKTMSQYLTTLAHDTRREKHRLWYELVEEYSHRLLTNPSDRLAAISGLADKYKSFLGNDRYLAGLWENDMVRGLLWHVAGTKIFEPVQPRAQHSSVGQYPSWSWLSVAPGLSIRNDHASSVDCKDIAHAQHVHIDEQHLLPYVPGGIKSAIRLRGPALFFSQLYSVKWHSSETLSPFEKHISQLIELEYTNSAMDLALSSKFAAVLMLRHLPSIDRRLDVLVLENCRFGVDL